MTQISMKEAWNQLLTGDVKRVYTTLGFYALGDAYSITESTEAYENQIVLVEHREHHQYNHWGYRKMTSEYKVQPTIFTNGDDGYGTLKHKAGRLKVRNVISKDSQQDNI